MSMTKTARQLLDEVMTEKQFIAQVIRLAQSAGYVHYHTLRSKGSDAGFPDLILLRPPREIVIELKREGGKITPHQEIWLDLFSRCGREVYLFYPHDWEQIEAILQ